jgi:hypothetical protein
MTAILGGVLTAGAASAALTYAVRKDAAARSFSVKPSTGGSGASSWPERWPEDWIEKQESKVIEGVWFTHSSDYHAVEYLKQFWPSGVSEQHRKRGIGTFFPFRIQWDLMKFDQQVADKRLAAAEADLAEEKAKIKKKLHRAHTEWTAAARNASQAQGVMESLRPEDSETSSDPDLVQAARDKYRAHKKALKALEKAAENKYAAAAAAHNLTAKKALSVYPDLYWMRDVRIIEMGSIDGVPAGTSHPAGVSGEIEVIGGRVSDTENGYVDIVLRWTETHRILKAQHWNSRMRVFADGTIEAGEEKLAERFQHFGTVQVDPRLRTERDRRVRAAKEGHDRHGAYAEIPDIEQRIPTGARRPFVEQALRLPTDGKPKSLVIETHEDGSVTFSMTRAPCGPAQMRIARTGEKHFRVTHAKTMRRAHKRALTLAFEKHGKSLTIED